MHHQALAYSVTRTLCYLFAGMLLAAMSSMLLQISFSVRSCITPTERVNAFRSKYSQDVLI